MKVHCENCGFDGNIWRGLVPPEGKRTACPLCGTSIFIPGTEGGEDSEGGEGPNTLDLSADGLSWPSDETQADEPRLPLFDGLPLSAEIRVLPKSDSGKEAETAESDAPVLEDDETYGFINPSATTLTEKKQKKAERAKGYTQPSEKPGWIQALVERGSLLKQSFSAVMARMVSVRLLLITAAAIGLAFFAVGYVVNLAGAKMDAQLLSEEYRERADVKDEEMDYIKAAEYYAVSIHVDPNNYKSLNNMASMYLQIHRYDDAVELLDEAISIIGTDDAAVSYANRGLAYLGLGSHDRALEDLNTAVAISPDLSYAYTARGFCYLAMGEPGKALLEFETACDLGDRNGCLLYEEHRTEIDE